MDNEELWIRLIDERIDKYFQSHNIVQKYSATVISITGHKYQCRIAGYDTVMPFLNKTNGALLVGDSVFVETTNNNLTNGVITMKFGT